MLVGERMGISVGLTEGWGFNESSNGRGVDVRMSTLTLNGNLFFRSFLSPWVTAFDLPKS